MLSVLFKTLILSTLFLFVRLQNACNLETGGLVLCYSSTADDIQTFFATVQDEYNTLKIVEGIFPTFDSTIVPQSAAKVLKEVDLYSTDTSKITSDALKYFDSLETFGCKQNQIKIIEPGTFENVTTLTVLNFFGSSFETLNNGTFWNLNQVEKIILTSTQIEVIPSETFKNLPNLKMVKLDKATYEQIEVNAFDNVPKLLTFIGAWSQLTTVSSGILTNLPNLFYVDLSHNNISYVEFNAFDGSPLEYLFLGSNHLKVIDAEAFSGIPHLLELHLDNNRLADLNVTELANFLPSFVLIYLEGNPWLCSNLPQMFDDFDKSDLLPVWGAKRYIVKNYRGVPCK